MTLPRDAGFSLVELLVAMAVMLLISGAAVTALLKMTSTQATLWNRAQMHSGIRGATEVLQQEVGQAGRVALPNTLKFAAAIGAGAQTVALACNPSCATDTTPLSGVFVNELLTVDAGCSDTMNPCLSAQEVVQVTAMDTSTSSISATFANAHALNAPVQVFGGFKDGVIPPLVAPSLYAPSSPASTYANGSTGSTLKMFGDINADGNMVYVEYSVLPACICTNTCTPASTTGSLYRNSMAFDAGSKSAPTTSQALLSNVTANPGGATCFSYQTATSNGTVFVLDVAVTLTVQTQQVDPITKSYQTETKALLNVSPRNVFNAWELMGFSVTDRIQATPASITTLLQ
jgi:prepilin-type N-terminal cleavage/methylation domain-containing protein